MERQKLWLWYALAVHKKYATAHKLLQVLGGIDGVYAANRKQYLDTGLVKDELLERLVSKDLRPAEKELWYAGKYNVKILCIEDEAYPQALREIPQPPLVLYVRGNWFDPENAVCISIVGTRQCSEYGKEIAYRLAFDLASCGAIVVSGMAKGIDGAAHRGALAAGGKTIAVLGCGVNRAYPKIHLELMGRIMGSGSVISEYDFSEEPLGGNFPRRNRMIAGLSLGTVVVEAGYSSGSLITADLALDCGKDVFAVPGNVGDSSEGTNDLIKKGAKIVTCAKDILEEYNVVYGSRLQRGSGGRSETSDADARRAVLRALSEGPKTIDEIYQSCELTLPQVNGAVTILELEGRIYPLSGKRYHAGETPE